MMSYQEVFGKLEQNPPTVSNEAVRLLCKIAGNILKHPTDTKIRILQKNNATISTKILSVKGGKECLKLMGFAENSTVFSMPSNVPLKMVEEFKTALSSWNKLKEQKCGTNKAKLDSPTTSDFRDGNKTNNTKKEHSSGTSKDENPTSSQMIKKVILPPLTLTYSNPLLRRMETYCHYVLQHEDKDLQERTRRLIPITMLEKNAQNRLRKIQQHIKKNKLPDPELSVQDTMILELLRWFKEDFFEWVDSPECASCGNKTSFSHMSTDANQLKYTDRVELHRCKSCQHLTPFPRYNDLNILLETRKGRCGEWANTFNLCCRALGWDSRFIVEEGDHVWTEVYSVTQKRWLHCDPCENVCDSPLIYETGWHKQISYVMAYSAEDVQDVTWRYSSRHKEVLKRRKICTERELLEAVFKIRARLQKDLSEPRKQYLTKRTLAELVEFLTEKKPGDEDQKGRSSGSEMWRMARGEIEEPSKQSLCIWRILNEDIEENAVNIRYSSSLDRYEYVSGGKVLKTLKGWHEGAHEHNALFRKEEKDWKMVYLTRKENQSKGSISWKFDLLNSQRILDKVILKFDYETFENATVDVRICAGDVCLSLPKGQKVGTFSDFTGSKDLSITATLSGGKGDVAWQHAQLFRQSIEDKSFNFSLTLTFQ